VPEHLRHGRYGIKTWQHPKLLAALSELAPEIRLLSLIDEVIFTQTDWDGTVKIVPKNSWEGTAELLERRLRDSGFGPEAQRLLSWHGATGTYLARLVTKFPERVIRARTAGTRNWILHRPDQAHAEQTEAA
jgi:hypothetical protein